MLLAARVTSFRTCRSTGPLSARRIASAGSEKLPVGTVSRTPPEVVVARATRRSPLDSVNWMPVAAVAESAYPAARSTTRSCPGRPIAPDAERMRFRAVMTFPNMPGAFRIEPPAAVSETSPSALIPATLKFPASCRRAILPNAAALVAPLTLCRRNVAGEPSELKAPIEPPLAAKTASLATMLAVLDCPATIPPEAAT